jgi:hypothetical protein
LNVCIPHGIYFCFPHGIYSPYTSICIYDLFYPKLNPDIVPIIIRFWDSPNIEVTIYVCRIYSTFIYTNCQSDNMYWLCLCSPL